MLSTDSLSEYCDQLLQVSRFQDYSPNGLQVRGRPTIKTLVTGVTACYSLLLEAIAAGADAILVHHGYFWKGESPTITGIKRQRLALLLQHNVNLLAYHLPLDAHPDLGNNVQLARRLNFTITAWPDDPVRDFLVVGQTHAPMKPSEFAAHLAKGLQREPLHILAGPDRIHRIAWCTGAAQDEIERAAQQGVDAFISGEISERTVHAARELGLHYFAAGHHATERYGIQALGEYLAEQFGLRHEFIDIANPV